MLAQTCKTSSEGAAELSQEFSHLPDAVEFNVFEVPVQILFYHLLLLVLFFWAVWIIYNLSSILQSIVHGELLFQLPNLFFIFLSEEVGV